MVDIRRQMAEQALRIIAAGHPNDDLELSIEEMMLGVDQAFAEIIKQSYFENKQMEDEHHASGQFLYPFILDIQKDEVREKYFAKIPTSISNLPGNLGINYVGFVNESDSFPVVPSNFISISRGMPVAQLGGRIGCYVEGGKIFLINAESYDVPEKILAKLVCGTMGSVDQPIELPLDIQRHIVTALIQMYLPERQMPHDNINDGVAE